MRVNITRLEQMEWESGKARGPAAGVGVMDRSRWSLRSTKSGGLLAGVYGWFTEGHSTLDLREARTFWDEDRPSSGIDHSQRP